MSVVKAKRRSSNSRTVLGIDTEAGADAAEEILSGVKIAPRVIETAVGRVEFDLTGGEGPVVLSSHGGIGGVDQARVMLGWLDPTHYRLLSVSRPGYLNTPLASGQSFEEQADLFAALLDALGIERERQWSPSRPEGRRGTCSPRATLTGSRGWWP
jgi:pimeloyl-ACP methyl ester carboxylesterase